jgi:hypothetical protein
MYGYNGYYQNPGSPGPGAVTWSAPLGVLPGAAGMVNADLTGGGGVSGTVIIEFVG